MDKITTKLMFSSKSNEWSTPDDFYRKLEQRFGLFDLDPAASAGNTKCTRFYTKADNGLLLPWDGDNVFCNPPYGRGLGQWVDKAQSEQALHDNQIVKLIPARTDTKYWHSYVMPRAAEVHLVKGRLKFGGSKNSAPFPSAVVVYHHHVGDVKFYSIDAK